MQFSGLGDVSLGDEGDNNSCLTCASGSTGAVEVILVISGDVEVDNTADIVDVDAPRRDVGRHKGANAASGERREGAVTL